MKKSFFYLTLLLLAVVLAGCSNLVTLKYVDGKFTGGGCVYLPASPLYEPTMVGDAYAYYKKSDVTWYTIGENDPTLWLTEAYAGSMTTVLHAESITLPSLRELNPEKIIVCQSDEVTIGLCEITDAEVIAAVVDCFENGDSAEWPVIGSMLSLDLKFYSSAWPQIYMNLAYDEFESGTFLYDRGSRRCVEIGELLDAYIHPDRVSDGIQD